MAKVLIYGASGGIGSTLARVLAREGYDLHLSGRDAARLSSLAQELGAGFTVVQDCHKEARRWWGLGVRQRALDIFPVGCVSFPAGNRTAP